MQTNIVYASATCLFCIMTFKLLERKNIIYQKIMIDNKPHLWNKIKEKIGHTTIPQVFIGDIYIGEFNNLSDADFDDKSDKLINE